MNASALRRYPRATWGRWRGLLLAGGVALLALLLAILPLPVAAGLVGGVAIVLLCLAQPLAGVVLLLLAVPFGSPFNTQIGGFNFGPTEMLFGLSVAAWLGRKLIARDLPAASTSALPGLRRLPLISVPLMAWLFALGLTLTVTHSLPESLKEILKWTEVLFVCMVVADSLPRRQLPHLLVLVFGAAALESMIGLYQTATRIGPEPFFVPLGGQLIMRSYGTFEQPNPFAAYLDFSLPVIVSILIWFAIGLWERRASDMTQPPKPALQSPGQAHSAPFPLFAPVSSNSPDVLVRAVGGDSVADTLVDPQHRRWKRPLKGPLRKLSSNSLSAPILLLIGSLLTVPFIAAAFFFSLSRGAWLGFAMAVVVMTALRSRRAFLLFALAGIILTGLLLIGSLNILPQALAERIADVPTFLGLNLFDPRSVLLTDENFGIVDRMAHWFAAWNMFNDFPWLGVGIGNYGVVYPLYGLREWPFSLGHAHNFYLNMLAETGLIGFLFYGFMVISALVYAWKVSRETAGVWRAVSLGILGALVALSVHNFFDNLYVHGMNIQFGLLLGFLARLKAER